MFGEFIIGYLFLGGTGAGALIVLGVNACREAVCRLRLRGEGQSVGDFRTALARNFHGPGANSDAYAWGFCFLALALGVLVLLADLGRPDRIAQLLLTPRFSVVTVGAYALVASLVFSAIFYAESVLDTLDFSTAARLVLGVAGVASGVVTAAYTGMLLQDMVSVLFWQTPLLPALFFCSALSCGLACVILGRSFDDASRHPRGILGLAYVDVIAIAIESLCLIGYLVWAFSDKGTSEAAHALVSGDLCAVFWAGVVLCGLVVPFASEVGGVHRKRSAAMVVACIVLVGGLALRWCIVEAAAFDAVQVSDSLYGMALYGMTG